MTDLSVELEAALLRALKAVWRERNHENPDWLAQYRTLEAQSEQVRRTALTIFQHLLR